MTRTTVGLLLAVVGCGSNQGPAPEPTSVPGSGAAYSMREPSPELAAAATPFVGSCAFAKTPGELNTYEKTVRAAAGTEVYASADFGIGTSNRIGKLREAASSRASGPIASSHETEHGFAILVVDSNGRVCRGYVFVSAVREK